MLLRVSLALVLLQAWQEMFQVSLLQGPQCQLPKSNNPRLGTLDIASAVATRPSGPLRS